MINFTSKAGGNLPPTPRKRKTAFDIAVEAAEQAADQPAQELIFSCKSEKERAAVQAILHTAYLYNDHTFSDDLEEAQQQIVDLYTGKQNVGDFQKQPTSYNALVDHINGLREHIIASLSNALSHTQKPINQNMSEEIIYMGDNNCGDALLMAFLLDSLSKLNNPNPDKRVEFVGQTSDGNVGIKVPREVAYEIVADDYRSRGLSFPTQLMPISLN